MFHVSARAPITGEITHSNAFVGSESSFIYYQVINPPVNGNVAKNEGIGDITVTFTAVFPDGRQNFILYGCHITGEAQPPWTKSTASLSTLRRKSPEAESRSRKGK